MAVTLIRSGMVKAGYTEEAIGLLREGVSLVNRIVGKQPELATGLGGKVPTIYLVTRYDSFAQLGEASTKLLANADYLAYVKKVANVLIEGSIEDRILNHI
jgi:hypothetical protein